MKLAVSAEGVDNPDGVELEVAVTVDPTYLQVEFDAADGTPAPAAQTVRWGMAAQEPDAPQLAGYTFQGWYAQGADAAWDFKTPVTSALALTAKWEPIMLSVTFDAAGGAPAPDTQSVKWGEQAEEPTAPEWEGHTFLGWYAQGAENAWDFKTPVTSALELTAKWEPVVLSVTFDAAGGAPAPDTQLVAWGEQAQEPEKPVWEGHTFLGWYAQGAEAAWDFTTPVTSTLALTAKWELVMYDVDFAYANGQGAERVTVAHGSVLAAPAAPTRAGYAFLGWYTDSGTRYNFSTPVTSSFALTAWWTPTPTTFIDVEEGSWYEGWVARAASLGLMSGYTDGVGAFTGYFGPEDALTRGQVATVLWRMARAPKPQGAAPFPEDDVVPGMYYYQAVSWCCEQGIITGYESGEKAGTFRPSDPVSREELALMVARFERWAGVDTSGAPTANFDRCTDAASVSDWAADAVTWTAASGVLGGKEIPGESGTTYRLDPQQGATRAQAAKVFARAWEIQHGAEPYETQVLAEETAQATGDTAAQEATFDDVTFEDVAAEGVQTSEGAAEEAQVAGDEGAATDPMASEQQVAEDTHAAAEAQDADEDAPQFEFDTEPSSESSDSPTEDATYAQAA